MQRSRPPWFGHWRQAVLDDPEGLICRWCGKLNDFYDDIGWFYCWPFGGSGSPHGATCEKCYRGHIGELHVARHGLGER